MSSDGNKNHEVDDIDAKVSRSDFEEKKGRGSRQVVQEGVDPWGDGAVAIRVLQDAC